MTSTPKRITYLRSRNRSRGPKRKGTPTQDDCNATRRSAKKPKRALSAEKACAKDSRVRVYRSKNTRCNTEPRTSSPPQGNSKDDLFLSGTRAAAAWRACGGLIMEYMSTHEILELSATHKDVRDSVATWAWITRGVADVKCDERIAALGRIFPQARIALETWASNQHRGALTLSFEPSVKDVIQYFRRTIFEFRRERAFLPKDMRWLKKHTDLRDHYFPILCDWLIELHFELFGDHARRLQCDSPLGPIHRSMRYLFFYLNCCKKEVLRERLQLVGVSCYSIAIELALGSSETRRHKLDAERYVHYTAGAYIATEVKDMTEKIKRLIKARYKELGNRSGGACSYLTHLEPLMIRTPTEIIESIIDMMHRERNKRLDLLTRITAYYAIDLAMHDVRMSAVRSSRIAAAAVAVACKQTGVDIDRIMLSIRSGVDEQCLNVDEKRLSVLFENAKLQEIGDTGSESGFNTRVLPKHSTVVKHYRLKMIECFQGQLEPIFKKKVLTQRSLH